MSLSTDGSPLPRLRLPSGSALEPVLSPAAVIARLVAGGSAVTRSDITAASGLARTTISAHVEALCSRGILRTVPPARSAGRGRPAERLELAPGAGLVAAIDIGATRTRVALAHLDQRLVAYDEHDLDLRDGPEPVIRTLRDHVLATARRFSGRPLLCAVVGVPARVDTTNGAAVRPSVMPGWDGYPLSTELSEHLGVGVALENDVNLRALGESAVLGRDQLPLVGVKLGAGVGAGIVDQRGQLFRGFDGGAGDIGHIPVQAADGVPCNCGRTGCLEAVASLPALAAQVGLVPPGHGRDDGDARAVLGLLRRHDRAAVAAARRAAEALGEVLVSVCNTLNPRRVVLGGELLEHTDELLAGVRGVVYERARPLTTRNLTIEQSVLRERGGIAGALVLAVERALGSIS